MGSQALAFTRQPIWPGKGTSTQQPSFLLFLMILIYVQCYLRNCEDIKKNRAPLEALTCHQRECIQTVNKTQKILSTLWAERGSSAPVRGPRQKLCWLMAFAAGLKASLEFKHVRTTETSRLCGTNAILLQRLGCAWHWFQIGNILISKSALIVLESLPRAFYVS